MTPTELIEFYCLSFVQRGEVMPDGCDAATVIAAGHARDDAGQLMLTIAGEARLATLATLLAARPPSAP